MSVVGGDCGDCDSLTISQLSQQLLAAQPFSALIIVINISWAAANQLNFWTRSVYMYKLLCITCCIKHKPSLFKRKISNKISLICELSLLHGNRSKLFFVKVSCFSDVSLEKKTPINLTSAHSRVSEGILTMLQTVLRFAKTSKPAIERFQYEPRHFLSNSPKTKWSELCYP